jgi:hypothetical protein
MAPYQLLFFYQLSGDDNGFLVIFSQSVEKNILKLKQFSEKITQLSYYQQSSYYRRRLHGSDIFERL